MAHDMGWGQVVAVCMTPHPSLMLSVVEMRD